MQKKDKNEDVKIIIQYQNENENKINVNNFQNVMQKLFNSYIIKAIQNIRKGK